MFLRLEIPLEVLCPHGNVLLSTRPHFQGAAFCRVAVVAVLHPSGSHVVAVTGMGGGIATGMYTSQYNAAGSLSDSRIIVDGVNVRDNVAEGTQRWCLGTHSIVSDSSHGPVTSVSSLL